MTAKKAARIKRIRLVVPMPFGTGAVVEYSVGTDSTMFGSTIKVQLNFDADDRFIRVDIGEWTGLVPLSNVGMIQLEPA